MSEVPFENIYSEFEDENVIDEKCIKFMLLGKESVGKTSFQSSLYSNQIPENHIQTLLEYQYFQINTPGDISLVKLTDSAGEEGFIEIVNQMVGQNDGFFIIYSIDDDDSFKQIEDQIWRSIKQRKEQFYAVLIGNKKDKENERKVSYQQGKQLADKLKIPFHEISLKNDSYSSKLIFNQLLLSMKKGTYQYPQKCETNNTTQTQQDISQISIRSKHNSTQKLEQHNFKQTQQTTQIRIKENRCCCTIY